MTFFNLRRFFKTKDDAKDSTPSFYASIYPEAIRYALQYKSAQMGKAEIKSLLGNYLFETVYLVTKALAVDREQQRIFLQALARLYAQNTWTENDLRKLLYQYIETLPDDVSIDGAKLAQLNRTDDGTWQDAFKALALRCVEVDSDKYPVVILHTPMLAFHHFVEIFSRLPTKKFLLIVPKWMEDPDDDQMGYKIALSDEPTVSLQETDECIFGEWECMKLECKLHNQLCGKCVFIDDTIKTAATTQKVRSFWEGEYGKRVPESRIRVITNLRDKTDITF